MDFDKMGYRVLFPGDGVMFSSLRWRFSITYLLIIVLVMSLSGAMLDRTVKAYFLNNAQISHFTQANIIANLLADKLRIGDTNIDKTLLDFSSQMGGRVLYLDQNGKVLKDSFETLEFEGVTLKHPEVISALAGQGRANTHFIGEDGWAMYITAPVMVYNKIVGAVLLSVSIDQVMESINALRWHLFITFLIIGLAVMLLSMFIAGYLTIPVKALTGAAKKMAEGNLSARVKVTSRDELGELAKTFNYMGEQLEQYHHRQKTFVANASHELRSPLSSIKVLVESLINDKSNKIELYKEFLTDIDTEITRLAKLIDNLLDLARMDKIAKLRQQSVDINYLCKEVVEGIRPLAESKGLTITFSGSASWPQYMDGEMMYQMLWNLTDNAVKFTQKGGRVEVTLKEEKDFLEFKVEDTGIGIAEEYLHKIFERFSRIDVARSRDTGGFGLGLALVKEIVELHGGTIDVKSRPSVGSVFTVRIPVVKQIGAAS
jgi:two-component system OmpR family sensor kinase